MKKNRPVSVRLTEEQRADLDLAASAAGKTPSAYLRELLADDRAARDGRPPRPGSERGGLAALDEVLEILSSEARAGDVSAARLLLRHYQAGMKPAGDDKPPAEAAPEGSIDQLAELRAARAG